jgi:hypothetical protein
MTMTTSGENEKSPSIVVADSDPDSATSRHGVILAEEWRKNPINIWLIGARWRSRWRTIEGIAKSPPLSHPLGWEWRMAEGWMKFL